MENKRKDPDNQKKSKTKRLKRSIKDKYLLGVCGGLGEYFNVDVTIVRILWVASIFFGGAGLIAYLTAAILMPRSETDAEEKINRESNIWIVVGWILIISGFFFLFDRLHFIKFSFKGFDYINFFYFPWNLLWPIVIIFLGIYLAAGKSRKEKILKKIRGKNLFRSGKNKMVSGVCGGLGEYLNIDPTFIRIVWVIISLISGIVLGIVVYFIFALIIPYKNNRINKF